MGKKFDDTLKYLDSDYSVKGIDLEECIYRKIGNIEIEISGLQSYGKYDATIFIWENEVHMLKSIQDISSKEELARRLETVVQELLLHTD